MGKLSPERRNRIIAVAVLVLLAVLGIIVYVRIGKPMTELIKDTERLQQWVQQFGWKSRLIYIGLMCAQVIVAVVPGEPLELTAGYIFGALEGTLLCLAGIMLGSVIVFGLVRAFGRKFVELFFSREKIDSLRIMKDPRRLFLVTAVLMLLPGTPKDLLTYCAGLTKIPFGMWLLLSSVGRIPSVITSTLGGSAIGEGNFGFAAIVFGVTTLLCGAGLWIYAKFKTEKRET